MSGRDRNLPPGRFLVIDREIAWLGPSLRDLRRMPLEVRRVMGSALHWAQTSGVGPDGIRRAGFHPAARRMKGDLAGVVEIRDDDEAGTYRTVYAAKLGARVYVLHVFQKKSKRGIETPLADIDVIRARLRTARGHAERSARGDQNS